MNLLEQRKQEVLAKVQQLTLKAEQLYNITLPKIDVRFDLRGRVAGWAGQRGFNHYFMRFNVDMMVNKSWDHLLNDTVPHELAHIICFFRRTDRGHGWAWKITCRALGGSGQRCHNEEVEYAKGTTYYYVTTQGHTVSVSQIIHRRIQKGSNYTYRGKGQITRQCAFSTNPSQLKPTPAPVFTQPTVPVQTKTVVAAPTGGTNADKVRAVLRQLKADVGSEAFERTVDWAVATLGMKRQLARSYVKNNWDRC